jgi:NTE family protein
MSDHNLRSPLFIQSLSSLFGEVNEELIQQLEPLLEWVEIQGGNYLFHSGDESDALYIMISGRLNAYVNDSEGRKVKIGDVTRGESVGEMAMFTGERRSADIIAARDSLLVKISKDAFEKIVVLHPRMAMNLTKLIISRQSKSKGTKKGKHPVNISILKIHKQLDGQLFLKRLHALLNEYGKAALVSSELADAALDEPGIAQSERLGEKGRKLQNWLDHLESEHDFLLFVADEEDTSWTKRCKRQADRILLLADATSSPVLTALELHGMDRDNAHCTLVLKHPPQTVLPEHTIAWLEPRTWLNDHFHLRTGSDKDLQRLARILSGRAVGFVMAGGGAKGFSHIGMARALFEYNIPIDYVGGTSIGAMVTAALSMDRPIDEVQKVLRHAALLNPTKDLNIWPMVSIMSGRRVERMISDSIHSFTGRADLGMEDTWLPHYVISSNYTQAREEFHNRGSMMKALKASSAIPGLFPPVVKGNDLLVDGGTFNNFPVDVMAKLGINVIIGADFVSEKSYELKFEETPGTLELLRDRLKSKKQRKYRLPSLTSILLNSTLLYSNARRGESLGYLDLHFNPALKYGMTSWKAFDKIVEAGYKHAGEVLKGLSEEQLKLLRGQ